MKNNNNDILKKQQAFTIVEMLITIIIIGIIAGISILSAYAFIEKTKETECFGERRQIAAAYTIEKYTSGKDFETTIAKVMSEALNAEEISIASNEATYRGLCKDDGIYTVTPHHDMSVKAVCSVHGGGEETTSGDTGSGHYVYNTNMTVSIPDEYYWATLNDFTDFYNSIEASVHYPEGTVISIAGVCYIAVGEINIDPDQHDMSHYFGNGNHKFMEIKSPDSQTTPVNWSDALSSSSTSYEKGSICYYNGSYYVAKNNVPISNGHSPENKPGEWLKL